MFLTNLVWLQDPVAMRAVERILVVLLAGLLLILGYMLFRLGHKSDYTELQTTFGKAFSMVLSGHAPGLFFMVCGSILLGVAFFTGEAKTQETVEFNRRSPSKSSTDSTTDYLLNSINLLRTDMNDQLVKKIDCLAVNNYYAVDTLYFGSFMDSLIINSHRIKEASDMLNEIRKSIPETPPDRWEEQMRHLERIRSQVDQTESEYAERQIGIEMETFELHKDFVKSYFSLDIDTSLTTDELYAIISDSIEKFYSTDSYMSDRIQEYIYKLHQLQDLTGEHQQLYLNSKTDNPSNK